MAVNIRIRIPVYKTDKWGQLSKQGKIDVSSDTDTLSEGYAALREEIDQLLSKLEAGNRLADKLRELEDELKQKTYKLNSLESDIATATSHYESLRFFLEQFGVDTASSYLMFDKEILLKGSSTAAVEVLPGSESF